MGKFDIGVLVILIIGFLLSCRMCWVVVGWLWIRCCIICCGEDWSMICCCGVSSVL